MCQVYNDVYNEQHVLYDEGMPAPPIVSSHLKKHFRRTLLTLTTLLCAFGAGKLFQQIDIPAPFLLGSLFGLWILARIMARIQARILTKILISLSATTRQILILPRSLYLVVIAGLAVLIGAAFSPHLFAQAQTWLVSLLAMLLATVVATTLATTFLTRLRGYEKKLAFLCAIPGGQAEVLLVSQGLVKKDYVVALCHLMRVLVIFCATPVLLTVIGNNASSSTTLTPVAAVVSTTQPLFEVSLPALLLFVGFALFGYLGARALRLPFPYLLGPLALSLTAHLSGITAIPRIEEFMLLAQITVGGTLGLKLAQVRFHKLAPYALDAIVSTTLVLSVYGITAALLAAWTETSFWQMLLAFIPGGLNEVSLLAFLFGYDVAFIAFHHAARLLLIVGTVSFLSNRAAAKPPP